MQMRRPADASQVQRRTPMQPPRCAAAQDAAAVKDAGRAASQRRQPAVRQYSASDAPRWLFSAVAPPMCCFSASEDAAHANDAHGSQAIQASRGFTQPTVAELYAKTARYATSGSHRVRDAAMNKKMLCFVDFLVFFAFCFSLRRY